jgi:hypothetical protein
MTPISFIAFLALLAWSLAISTLVYKRSARSGAAAAVPAASP